MMGIAIIATLAIVACNKEKQNKSVDHYGNDCGIDLREESDCFSEVVELYDISDFSDYGWSPEGTDFYYEGDKMIIEAPNGWVYVGYVDGDLYVTDGSKTAVSCTCNTSGDCLPGKIELLGHTFYGCYGDCSNCTMEVIKDKPNPERKDGIKSEIIDGGYVNLNNKPFIITNPSEELPMVFDAMFEIPLVQDLFEEFLLSFYQDKDYPKMKWITDSTVELPEGFKFVPVNLCGRTLLVALPESELDKTMSVKGSASASCSCTAGSCKLQSYGAGVRCKGNCTGTCTLYDKSPRSESLFVIKAYNH